MSGSGYTYEDVRERFTRLQFEEVGKSSGGHHIWKNPTGEVACTVPDFGDKPIWAALLLTILDRLRISWSEFEHA